MSLSVLVRRLTAGRHVGVWLTKEPVRLALPGCGEAVPPGHRLRRAAIVIAAAGLGLWAAPAALAANAVYWDNSNANTISFANLDGSGGGDLTTTGATVSDPTGVALDPAAGLVYWADQSANKISFANVDGSGGGDLTTTGATVRDPTGVALDPAAGRVYWANETANKVSFANLDGSGGGDLVTTGATANGPGYPALLDAPSRTGAPAVSGGSTIGSQLSCSQGSWAADLVAAFLYRAPAGFAYQWNLDRADIAGAIGSSITGLRLTSR